VSSDKRVVRATVAWIRDEFAAAAQRHARFGVARLVRLDASRIGAAADAAVHREHALIEMNVGEMEHLTGSDLRERYPDFLAQWLSPDAADARMPGGETMAEVQERAWGASERIRERHADGIVVAVTHNFVILMLLCRALGLPVSNFRRLKSTLASKTVLDITERGSQLLQLNDTAHLMAAGLADDLLAREARP
jgi:probable phosphoglycerate mutase